VKERLRQRKHAAAAAEHEFDASLCRDALSAIKALERDEAFWILDSQKNTLRASAAEARLAVVPGARFSEAEREALGRTVKVLLDGFAFGDSMASVTWDGFERDLATLQAMLGASPDRFTKEEL